MKTDKETIMLAALKLFAEKGYKAASMRALASEVGIKPASLYNHFDSKEKILQAILDEAGKRYDEKREHVDVPDNDDNLASQKYDAMTDEKFLSICKELFMFYVDDPFMSNLRKMLCNEQFADPELGKLYRTYFYDNIIQSQSRAFGRFIKDGKFKECNPHIVALHFYAPIFLLYTVYDNGAPKEEVMKDLEEHVVQFSKNYSTDYQTMWGEMRNKPCEI